MYGHIKMVCCKITLQTDFTRKSGIFEKYTVKTFFTNELSETISREVLLQATLRILK